MKKEEQREPALTKALDQLQAADFHPWLGDNFSIRFTPEEPAIAQLEQVVELTGYSTLERKPFSILLQTTLKTPYYQQAIYTIVHPLYGPLPVFLVPVGIKEKGVQYEAVFA